MSKPGEKPALASEAVVQAAEGPSEAGFTVAEVVVYCAVVASTASIAFSSWHRFRTRHELPWLLVSLLAMWFVIGIRRYRATALAVGNLRKGR